MTTPIPLLPEHGPLPLATELRHLLARSRESFRLFLGTHRISLFVLVPVLAVTSVIRLWNFTNTPATWNDDEGTYTAQAYAVLHYDALAHYTYWYDHPPFGWLQIAGWAWLTNGFDRYGTAIMVGREFMGVCAIVSGILLYVLCRKLRIARPLSALAVVLFMISPIALYYGKMAFLDNIMIPWFLGSLVLAVMAGRRSILSLLCGICFAGAFLTKETIAPFVVGVLLVLVVSSGRGFRLQNVILMLTGFALFGVMLYVALAALKGEFIPGKGHVSLVGAIQWQLIDRADSGPLLAQGGTFMSWVDRDPWLMLGGLVMLAPAFLKRRFWGIVLLGVVGGGLIVRGGYLPSPYVLTLLPIGALSIAAGLQALWERRDLSPRYARDQRTSRFGKRSRQTIAFRVALKVGEAWGKVRPSAPLLVSSRVLAIALCAAFVFEASPAWASYTASDLTDNGVNTERQAIEWITKHSPADQHAQFVVDEVIWMDLINRGYSRDSVDWFYKIDADPAVLSRYLPPDGDASETWKHVTYVVIPDIGDTIIDSVPTLRAAIAHATVVANFGGKGYGSYSIYEVHQ